MASPLKPIRRFDVFAEYNRQERREKGDPADVAKGYGIWVAKVVASRRGRTSGEDGGGHKGPPPPLRDGKWHTLDDKPQTDALFDHEIIDRMGSAFYTKTFVPAIEDARQAGKSYEAIRDSIRKGWKPDRDEDDD